MVTVNDSVRDRQGVLPETADYSSLAAWAPPSQSWSVAERQLNVLEGLCVFLTAFVLILGTARLRWR